MPLLSIFPVLGAKGTIWELIMQVNEQASESLMLTQRDSARTNCRSNNEEETINWRVVVEDLGSLY